MRLAVSGAQPLFTLGLLLFALSLVDFLSLMLSPSTDIKIFYFCQKYHLKDTYKIFKKFHVGLKFEWGWLDQYWLSCEGLPFEVFFSCLYDGLLGIAYANMLVTTKWPLKRAAHLASLVRVCVVWLPESLMELSALWFYYEKPLLQLLYFAPSCPMFFPLFGLVVSKMSSVLLWQRPTGDIINIMFK